MSLFIFGNFHLEIERITYRNWATSECEGGKFSDQQILSETTSDSNMSWFQTKTYNKISAKQDDLLLWSMFARWCCLFQYISAPVRFLWWQKYFKLAKLFFCVACLAEWFSRRLNFPWHISKYSSRRNHATDWNEESLINHKFWFYFI